MHPSILAAFDIAGSTLSVERFGQGHIHDTYLWRTDAPKAYILQRINGHVFTDIPALMRNIALVTAHLARKEPDPRRTLTLVPTRGDGAAYFYHDGAYYRAYRFIEGSVSAEGFMSEAILERCGQAFGRFWQLLSDFPAATLTETIPHFHDTPDRYRQLQAAIQADRCGRLAQVGPEVECALSYAHEAAALTYGISSGTLPLRVTHNDTKLNNVLLDAETHTPLCVIDLDTVMPGLIAYDFGDAVRFGASTAAEDEEDLSKVSLSLPLYKAFERGCLSICGDSLSPAERASLPMGAKLMTLECGIRFLTDYLNGDIYFQTNYPHQNLRRCRTQLKLVADMAEKWEALSAR